MSLRLGVRREIVLSVKKGIRTRRSIWRQDEAANGMKRQGKQGSEVERDRGRKGVDLLGYSVTH